MASPVRWTSAEQQAVKDEGVRLVRAGFAGSLSEALREAQKSLPKARRRTITTTAKVPWFSSAVRAAREGVDGNHQSTDEQTFADDASSGPGRHLVRWSRVERTQLCEEAARLVIRLEASGPHDALLKAQARVLAPKRQRPRLSPCHVVDWYPEALQAAMQRLRESEQQEPAAPPEVAREAAAVAPEPLMSPAIPTVASVLASPWAALREHLVQEIAGIVAEGVMRGLENVKLLAPQAPAGEREPRHVPFVAGPAKHRPPSVLVVGLRGGQVPQIQAEFGTQLDLRFCGADESKDQLRSMTEKAETTVAFVDFLSHSHTDIIRARSKHVVLSSGGMTALRQNLARLAGLHFNGHATHA